MNPTVIGNLKSKTNWFGLGLIVLGAAEQSGLLALIPAQQKGTVLAFVGFITLVLRQFTTGTVADKAVTTESK